MINEYVRRLNQILSEKIVDRAALVELLRILGNHLANSGMTKLSGKSVQQIGSIIGRSAVVFGHQLEELIAEFKRELYPQENK